MLIDGGKFEVYMNFSTAFARNECDDVTLDLTASVNAIGIWEFKEIIFF